MGPIRVVSLRHTRRKPTNGYAVTATALKGRAKILAMLRIDFFIFETFEAKLFRTPLPNLLFSLFRSTGFQNNLSVHSCGNTGRVKLGSHLSITILTRGSFAGRAKQSRSEEHSS